jgi:hypothetical protein
MAVKVDTPAPAGARAARGGAARRWWVLAVASVAQLMVVLDVRRRAPSAGSQITSGCLGYQGKKARDAC